MTQSAPQNVTKEMNIELLNVINSDVQNVKQFTKMPAISDELYNNFYNPKDKVAQTDINLPALYDIKTEKDKSEDNVIKSLNFTH